MTQVREKIYIAGHTGMVGSAIQRQLAAQGDCDLVSRSHRELDLADQPAVREFFASERPQQVYLAAARVGGIHANSTYPAEFIYTNLMIEANVIHAAFEQGVKRLMFLGSSCIYPGLAKQPMSEEALLTGRLESTNEPYAIAKIAGIKLCESYNRQYGESHGVDYRSVMPTNLYGPGDNFDLANSHVLPALIRKFHEAKEQAASEVVIWGTGLPRREFLHVDDMAGACVFVMSLSDETLLAAVIDASQPSFVNVGTGVDVTIKGLSETVRDVVGFSGDLVFDRSKPDGTPRKLLDVSRMSALGWRAQISLRDGIEQTYHWFLEHQASLRK